MEIAALLGASYGTVLKRMREAGIEIRAKGWRPDHKANHEARRDRVCERCGVQYDFSRYREYCSKECRDAVLTRACERCGKTFVKRTRDAMGRFCSRECHYYREEMHEYIDNQGYVRIRAGVDYPGANKANGYILKQRYVMQEFLGRPLARHETVHHISGDQLDNSIENLQLRQGLHGRGVRFACLDCGSHNVGPIALPEA